jgi:hypothetical protein
VNAKLIWFAPLILLTGLFALYGFRLGWIAANLTETDVIEARAVDYVTSAGPEAKPSDCQAWPGKHLGIWVIVRCGGASDAASKVYEYHVNRFGGVEYSGAPKAGLRINREDDA